MYITKFYTQFFQQLFEKLKNNDDCNTFKIFFLKMVLKNIIIF